jgi:hypothetical protein
LPWRSPPYSTWGYLPYCFSRTPGREILSEVGGSLRGETGEKGGDLAVGELRPLAVDEVSRFGRRLEGVIREVVAELVGPPGKPRRSGATPTNPSERGGMFLRKTY